MRDNGTDRDVALQIKQLLSDCADLVSTINSNLFSPHIITQPTNAVAVDQSATLTVTAVNAVAYQWKYRTKNSTNPWTNSAASGNNTDTVHIGVSEATLGLEFSCFITGKDGSVIQTNIVYITTE